VKTQPTSSWKSADYHPTTPKIILISLPQVQVQQLRPLGFHGYVRYNEKLRG